MSASITSSQEPVRLATLQKIRKLGLQTQDCQKAIQQVVRCAETACWCVRHNNCDACNK